MNNTKKQPILSKDRFLCPSCSRNLPTIRKYNFCPECGQELTYEGEEFNWDSRYKRPRILLDMDDCINDFLGFLIKKYNEVYNTNITRNDVKSWELDEVMPNARELFIKEGFFEEIPQKKGSIPAIKKMINSTKYDVYIITACNTNHELEEKFKWFDKYLPEFNKDRIIKCKEKELIRGDVLIDDKVDNLDKCSPFMECILFDMPSNKGCQNYKRVSSMGEAFKMIETMFYNKEG